MRVHELKTWPTYFEAIIRGVKTFEIRKDDRSFSVGDFLDLHEFDPDTNEYTGREASASVTYILRPKPRAANEVAIWHGLGHGYVIMSIELRHVQQ